METLALLPPRARKDLFMEGPAAENVFSSAEEKRNHGTPPPHPPGCVPAPPSTRCPRTASEAGRGGRRHVGRRPRAALAGDGGRRSVKTAASREPMGEGRWAAAWRGRGCGNGQPTGPTPFICPPTAPVRRHSPLPSTLFRGGGEAGAPRSTVALQTNDDLKNAWLREAASV